MNSTSGPFRPALIVILFRRLFGFLNRRSRFSSLFLRVLYVYGMILSVLIKLKINIVNCLGSFCKIFLELIRRLLWNRVQNLRLCHLLAESSINVQRTDAALNFNYTVTS